MKKILMAATAIVLTSTSIADTTETEIRVNRIDMAIVAPDGDDGQKVDSKATDYNSSRSNKSERSAIESTDEDDKGRPSAAIRVQTAPAAPAADTTDNTNTKTPASINTINSTACTIEEKLKSTKICKKDDE